MAKIKKGDLVVVISGRDRGKQGRVLEVLTETQRVVVEGVQRVTKHVKIGQSQRGTRTGGIETIEAPIHISNVMLVDPETKKGTRVGYCATIPPMFIRNVFAPKSATAATRPLGSTVESFSLRLACRNRIGSRFHQRSSAVRAAGEAWLAEVATRTAPVRISRTRAAPAAPAAVREPQGDGIRGKLAHGCDC